MNDQLLWTSGVERVRDLLAAACLVNGSSILPLLAGYREAKEAAAVVAAEADAAAACGECMGKCCLNGKYRMSVLDVMACVASQVLPAVDFFNKPLCPYGTVSVGCLMEPGFRPADCILFICDVIDEKLSPQGRSLLQMHESSMRKCISDASHLVGEPLGTPLLLWAGRRGTGKSDKYKG